MAGLLNQLRAAARIGVYLLIAYVAIQLWQDPKGAAQATVDMIEGVGQFFATLLDKIGQFVRGLSE